MEALIFTSNLARIRTTTLKKRLVSTFQTTITKPILSICLRLTLDSFARPKGFEFIPELRNFHASRSASIQPHGTKLTLSQFKRVIEPIIEVSSAHHRMLVLTLSFNFTIIFIFMWSTIRKFIPGIFY